MYFVKPREGVKSLIFKVATSAHVVSHLILFRQTMSKATETQTFFQTQMAESYLKFAESKRPDIAAIEVGFQTIK